MFSAKNISPRQLSLFTAFMLAIPVGIFVGYLKKDWVWGLAAFALMLTAAFLLIGFVLEKFIYRKLKLIFKFIYHTKASRREETYFKYILPRKSIDEVSRDVENWAAEQRTEIESLQRNEQFRREFLQNLSHEFKTPVFAIQGYLDILLSREQADLGKQKKFLEKTSRNVSRLLHLLNDLDEISALEQGTLTLYKQNFVIQELVREVFESLSPEREKNNISCVIKKGCELPLTVFADKERIRQVISNLVENSLRYGKQNGSIIASMYKTDGKHILVEISDDGSGISEKDLPRIFERFYRTERGRSMDSGGSGLGLAICKHIIEAHHQAIHVRSTEGLGTTVGFILDAKSE
jgi:two-component system, OmpR family, phosphate regulon sensor histidine kinase PhoR